MTAASFTFQSTDGTEIFAMKWSPEDLQKPKAAVQTCTWLRRTYRTL